MFSSVLRLGKKTATGIEVPGSVIDQLGAGRKPAVVACVNGYVYRTTVGVMAGRYMLPFSAEHREFSGLSAGDAVEVDLRIDVESRKVAVPQALEQALAGDQAAQTGFDALSYSRQRWFALHIEAAKTDPTRDKRVEAALQQLRSQSS